MNLTNLYIISLVLLIENSYSQLLHSIVGLVTETSFQLKARSQDGKSLNVYFVQQNEFIATLEPIKQENSENIEIASGDYYYQLDYTGLEAGQKYEINLEYSNTRYNNMTKTFTTPSRTANFTFAVVSHQSSPSSADSYKQIYLKNPNFMLFLGGIDNNYGDDTEKADLQEMYNDAIIDDDGLSNFTLNGAFEYYPTDFCGGETKADKCDAAQKSKVFNIWSRTFPTNSTQQQLNDAKGHYSRIVKAGVLFLYTDPQTSADLDQKTLFGSEQTAWLKAELEAAAVDSNIGGVVIAFSQSWNYNETAYDKDWVKQDGYYIKEEFNDEKNSIAESINTINYKNPNGTNFKSLMMVTGSDFMAFEEGRNNIFGGFPIATCGALKGKGSCKGGPFSHGYSKDFDDQYCMFEVYPKGEKTCFVVSAFLAEDPESDEDETNFYMYDTCDPQRYSNNLDVKCPILPAEKGIHVVIIIVASVIIFLFFFVFLYKIAERNFDYQIINKKED